METCIIRLVMKWLASTRYIWDFDEKRLHWASVVRGWFQGSVSRWVTSYNTLERKNLGYYEIIQFHRFGTIKSCQIEKKQFLLSG